MFCARILLKFASLNAANFSLPFMVNAVFSEVLCLLRACTLQETVHLSVFIKEVFHILERTSDERWVAEHPVIGQSGKALSLDEWEKLQRKFQVRALWQPATTLHTVSLPQPLLAPPCCASPCTERGLTAA